jgi:ABC transporter with metal-binding/Fe-S-binding domain ATP-binding protein
MRLAVLFSGGKDSVFACYRALEDNEVSCLITIISSNPESYMFHTPNIEHTGAMAKAMGIPHLVWRTEGVEEHELVDLRDAVAQAVQRYGIEGVVTGAIESVYQASRVQAICRDLDLWCFNPIWQIDQLSYMRQLVDKGFCVMVSGVFAYPMDASWLGRVIDHDALEKLEALKESYAINPSGEGGEIETFVLDAPMFSKRLRVRSATAAYHEYSGTYRIDELELIDK